MIGQGLNIYFNYKQPRKKTTINQNCQIDIGPQKWTYKQVIYKRDFHSASRTIKLFNFLSKRKCCPDILLFLYGSFNAFADNKD